jgi:alkylation response protein AidB-like acyl-CoA dehydrogenase
VGVQATSRVLRTGSRTQSCGRDEFAEPLALPEKHWSKRKASPLMDLTLSDDQEQLVAAIVDALDGELPMARLHGPDESRMAGEIQRLRTLGGLGWHRISLPEQLGGAGLGLAEEVLLFRELGRRLAPVSTLTAVLAGRLAATSGTKDLAEQILSGARAVAYATPEAPAQPAPGAPPPPLRLFSTGPSDLALLLAPDAAVLLDVASSPSIERPCLDRTMTMRSVESASAPVLARFEGAGMWNHGLLLLAANLVGQAEADRDAITAYAKIRTTFGRPIGAYQAVRHPIAEMAGRCEQARCQLFYAALVFDAARADADAQAGAARVLAQVAAMRNDDANIQLHGGIGVTDDLDPHLYLKRTTVFANWLGGAKHQLKALLNAPLLDI